MPLYFAVFSSFLFVFIKKKKKKKIVFSVKFYEFRVLPEFLEFFQFSGRKKRQFQISSDVYDTLK